MIEKSNIYEDKDFFKWLRKIGNYEKCPKCNPKFDPGNYLTKATFYCTECSMLWKFRRFTYSLKWNWYYIRK